MFLILFKALVANLQAEIATMSSAGGANEGELRQQIAKLKGELSQQKVDFEKEIAKLNASTAALSSGRDRLRQMQELQDARQREKEEFEARIAELEEQVRLGLGVSC